MKRIEKPLRKIGLLAFFSALPFACPADPVSHVVLVWLKEPGNPVLRERFIEASRSLNDLPGIISRHVGGPIVTDRSGDRGFDVAITATLKDREALEVYMNHPKHKRVVEEQLKPLVGKIVTYDFQ